MKTLAIALVRTLAMGGITIGAIFTLLEVWLIGPPLLLAGVYLERRTSSAITGKHSDSSARPLPLAALWSTGGYVLGWPVRFLEEHLIHGLSDPMGEIDLDRHRDDQWWYDLSAEQDHAALNSSDWEFYDTQNQRHESERIESTFDDIASLTSDDT